MHPRRSQRRSRQRGFTIVELLAALAIATLLVAGVMAMINTSLDDAKGQQTALYQQQLTQAAAQFITQNSATLLGVATTTTPVVVPLSGSTYQLATYLPAGVQSKNAYGQTPCLLVYANGSGALQGLLVTEGGTSIPDPQLGYIAANAGQGGGSIPKTNNAKSAAYGAFGSWSLASPNPANKSCSGTTTAVGHLVSEVFANNTLAQNGDFLYRVSVPGNTTANTMQVPIVLAQETDFSPCTAATGAVAADANNNVVTCRGGQWTPVGSLHWRDPVPSAADLGNLTLMPNPLLGDVAMTTNTGRAYTFNGTSWQAIAVNEQGYLDLGNHFKVGDSCAPDETNTTPVGTDTAGELLTCQNGTWQTQNEIEPVYNTSGCTILMASPNAEDYPGCGGVPAGAWTSGPFSYEYDSGTYTYTTRMPVTITKPGIIAVTVWGHMNDSLANGSTGRQAQMGQDLDLLDSGGNSIGHTEAEGPTLTDDSGGTTATLVQAVPAGTYQVQLATNWATYNVISTPWTSSYIGTHNNVIANTPIAEGWTINAYY